MIIGNKVYSAYGFEIASDEANMFLIMNNVPISSIEYSA
jgi:hypothetical protein